MQNDAACAPLVFIVVLNWNGWCDTLECLDSLRQLDYPNFRVVVVDNGSSDDSVRQIRLANPDIMSLQTGSNLGYAGGNNIGIQYALDHSADYIWLLNNDTAVEPDALMHLVARMKQRPEAGICGSTLIYFHNRNQVQALGGSTYNRWLGWNKHIGEGFAVVNIRHIKQDAIESRLHYIVGASMLVSREFVQDIGLMCTDYFLYCEEIDWAVRAKSRYALAYAAKSIVYHKEGSSAGGTNLDKNRKSRVADFYSLRSRILFTKRHFPCALPTIYLGLILAIANRMRRRQWSRIPMIFKLISGL